MIKEAFEWAIGTFHQCVIHQKTKFSFTEFCETKALAEFPFTLILIQRATILLKQKRVSKVLLYDLKYSCLTFNVLYCTFLRGFSSQFKEGGSMFHSLFYKVKDILYNFCPMETLLSFHTRPDVALTERHLLLPVSGGVWWWHQAAQEHSLAVAKRRRCHCCRRLIYSCRLYAPSFQTAACQIPNAAWQIIILSERVIDTFKDSADRSVLDGAN